MGLAGFAVVLVFGEFVDLAVEAVGQAKVLNARSAMQNDFKSSQHYQMIVNTPEQNITRHYLQSLIFGQEAKLFLLAATYI